MSSVGSTQKTLIRLAASEEELHFHFCNSDRIANENQPQHN